MTVARRKVVVGIKYDECCANQLLRCALNNVVKPGDDVLVLHMSPNSGCVSKRKALLDCHMQEYKSLCSEFQVDLKVELLVGTSYRKVLVKEANKRLASAVIVGVTKQTALRGWASVAVYCIKMLPRATDIILIYDGKIVYRRCPPLDSEGLETTSNLKQVLSFAGRSEDKGLDKSQHHEAEGPKICGYTSEEKADDRKAKYETLSAVGRSRRRALTCVSLPPEDFSQEIPGWPLLRTASLTPTRRTAEDARKMSVVKWAMSLPRRSLSMAAEAIGSDLESWGDETLKGRQQEANDELKLTLMKKGLRCKVFSYNLLKKATSCFSAENLIGKGGCNSVYKGVLSDGKKIAVKVRLSSKEAQKDFAREVDIMTAVRHKRITPILGICIHDDHLISVYEFLARGNLEQNLQGRNRKEKSCSLPWKARFKIAHGIAQALDYLHGASPNPIIHRDIKSSNILLNDDLEPQLSDFGLAVWGSRSSPFLVDTDVAGTFGYLAPEYLMNGEVSEKVDVYSYGVVLLELLSGKKPINCDPTRSGESLVMWARRKLESADVRSILDPKLDGKVDDDQVQKLGRAAKLCLAHAARLRPQMNQILCVLEGKDARTGVEKITCDDDELYPDSSVESHISVAFVDVNEDSESCMSSSSPIRMEDYLKSRWSRSSSFE